MPARLLREGRSVVGAVALCALLAALAPGARAQGYPTEAMADYVFACMASNGQTPAALTKCACSVDVIASILPYEEYVQAETVLRMRQVAGGGEKMQLFRDTALAKDAVEKLKRAQVEAEVRCF